MKILANDGISPSGIAKLEAAGVTVDTDHIPQDQLVAAINERGYVGLMVRSATKVRQDLIDACPNLKMIGRGGVGMDNIDVAYAREKGLEVFNTPASSSQSVAELVMGQLFSMARSLFDSERQMPVRGAAEFKALKKAYGKGVELRGKTLGIVGFGRIGRSLASYALGCGMDVIACDTAPGEAEVQVVIGSRQEITVPVPLVELNQLLSEADMVSLHVPKQADGGAVIGKAQLEQMKAGTALVNAARGGVVDEDALMEALDNGKLRYAALDVFENEPTPREDVLQHAKLALTPHIGAATVEAQDRIGLELADRILEVLQEA